MRHSTQSRYVHRLERRSLGIHGGPALSAPAVRVDDRLEGSEDLLEELVDGKATVEHVLLTYPIESIVKMLDDDETRAVYDAQADEYAKLAHGPGLAALEEAFLERVGAGGRILDFGCGPGRSAAAMRDAGHPLDALDASPGMAKLAKDQYGLDVTVAGFDSLTVRAAYDGIWASFSLLHVPKAE